MDYIFTLDHPVLEPLYLLFFLGAVLLQKHNMKGWLPGRWIPSTSVVATAFFFASVAFGILFLTGAGDLNQLAESTHPVVGWGVLLSLALPQLLAIIWTCMFAAYIAITLFIIPAALIFLQEPPAIVIHLVTLTSMIASFIFAFALGLYVSAFAASAALVAGIWFPNKKGFFPERR